MRLIVYVGQGGTGKTTLAAATALRSAELGYKTLLTSTDVTRNRNGIKLASDLLVYQLLPQFLPGFDHQGEALGPPFLDARLHAMGACRVHNQRHEWHARTWRAEPAQSIEEADPLHLGVLECRRWPHDHADEV